MQIIIYTRPEYLEEMSNFLKSDIPYEHNIPIYDKGILSLLSFPCIEVSVFYDDYVKLMDFRMENATKHRTEDTGPL
jgi:hypothetical protein